MEINLETIIPIASAVVAFVLGFITKNKPIPSKFIPIQNLAIGILTAVIALITGVYTDVALAFSDCVSATLGAGGFYSFLKIFFNTKQTTIDDEFLEEAMNDEETEVIYPETEDEK